MDGLKMLKILIVAFMATPISDYEDTYVFMEPYFSSVAECHAYLNFNAPVVIEHLYKTFDGAKIKNIYCLSEKQLNQFIENTRA